MAASILVVCSPGLVGAAEYYGPALIVLAVLTLLPLLRVGTERKRS